MWLLQNDVSLVHEIEAEIGKQLDEFECKENEVLADITKVWYLLYKYVILFCVICLQVVSSVTQNLFLFLFSK